MKLALTGTPVMENASHIVMQEGEATAKYSRHYYRLTAEVSAPMVDELTMTMTTTGFHCIAVPMLP